VSEIAELFEFVARFDRIDLKVCPKADLEDP
jgi:hypothetical protein